MANHLPVALTMMPSRSTPNLQQSSHERANATHYPTYFDRSEVPTKGPPKARDEESPPPAPPVRDSSTLKSIKYGPGHEKFPSWPVPAAAETPPHLRAPPGGGSHRSKSWTDHTNYPKEKVVAYTRPYMKRQHPSYTQQQKLKTVMERSEKIPSETFESRYDGPPQLYLSQVDRDGKSPHEAGYSVPSPPERDTSPKCPLTQADLEEYAKSYQEPVKCYLENGRLEELMHYRHFESSLFPKHQKQVSYAQSEGYHSYVSSSESTCTPFLDRLRRDSEAVAASWGEERKSEGRDSVVTTSSGSASSSETLKWHGSMSDVSVASSSHTYLANASNSVSKQLIAHSARVKTPQRHQSESVLYMGGEDSWRSKESRINSANKLKLFPVNTYVVPDAGHHNGNAVFANRTNLLSKKVPLSVADRINELENHKFSYLDPEKKHKVSDPTLKAIQKKALLSFYERHQNPSRQIPSRAERPLVQQTAIPQPPPRIKAQLPYRRASSASDYASGVNSKRSSLCSTRESKTAESLPKSPKHQYSNSCGSLSTDLLGPIIVGPSISVDDWVPDSPPARPPKNPNLRSVFPDLFNHRVPSPDLPPPSPPTVLEDEVFNNDDPLPPPPPECQEKPQNAVPQVQKKCQDAFRKVPKQMYAELLQVGFPVSRKQFENVAVSQKVAFNQYRAEPLRPQMKKDFKSVQRASIAESCSKDVPPPLQPRQARVNQSMRGRISHTVTCKEKSARELRSQSMSQSKASYLASRRDRDRVVPDSETGSYKRTMSPNGHSIAESPGEHMWGLSRTSEPKIKSSSITNLTWKSSFHDKVLEKKPDVQSHEPIVLPDVLPVNAKILTSRSQRPTNLTPPEKEVKASPPPTSPKECPNSRSPILTSYMKPVSPNESPPSPKERLSPVSPKLSPTSSPALEKNEVCPTVVEGLQMIQRTEVVLRVNTCTTDAASQTERDETTPLPTRKKLQEEIECEKLSEELVTHLTTSTRLKELLVPAPEHKKPTDYVQGLFKLDVTPRPKSANSPFRSKTNTPSNSPPPSVTTGITTTAAPQICSGTSPISSSLEPSSPLSTYLTISEPKAKFLTRYSQDMSQSHFVKDTKDLKFKKEELVNRLDRKLEVLRSEQLVVWEECKINDELGENVEAHIRRLARPHEAEKFRLHIEEVGKITSLLLGLSGRLARAENALMGMPDDHSERIILENKRDKLLGQLEEAKKLKECIDRRSVSVSNILYKYLNSEEYTDYDHFINMKTKLIMDSREIADKIKLGEEQLLALKETLIVAD